ncbi:unnamed protein product [Sphagnum troendelagicum]
MAALIEGLPDSVAIQCLARVPLSQHRVLQSVCKAWHALVRNPELYGVRKRIGTTEEWLYVSAYEADKAWQAYDPVYNQWSSIPPLPSLIPRLGNFGTVAVQSKLFILGGGSDEVNPITGDRSDIHATDQVWAYDPVYKRWSSRASMLTPRAQFACFSYSGRIVVAGGFSSLRRAISSVEMYNPELDQWEFLPDLVAVRDAPCSGVVLDGKMHVVQKGTCTAQVYDPTTKRWMQEDCAWSEGPMAVVNGELYIVHHGVVSREHRLPAHRMSLCSWPECLNRIGFGVAGLGSNLYVVGGIMKPRRGRFDAEYLNDVDVLVVGSADKDVFWEKAAHLPLSRGTVLGCAVLQL